MKKIFVFIVLFIFYTSFCNLSAFSAEISTENSAILNREIKAQINKIKTKRIIIANALLLNNAQKEKAGEIYSSVIEKEALLLAQLEKEKEIMKNLYNEENNRSQRRNQRRIIYNLQKAIVDVENQVDKDFKKILTHDQKVKFNRLKKEIIISDF